MKDLDLSLHYRVRRWMVSSSPWYLMLNRLSRFEDWIEQLKPSIPWALSWENLFMPYANNKGADQPAHPRLCCSLPGKYNTSTCYSRNFKTLASFWSRPGRFESYLVKHPEDRFSRDEAPIKGVFGNSVDTDQTPQNIASEQGLHDFDHCNLFEK